MKSEFNKLLVSRSKEGRSDGAYSRLFCNSELGALISRIHATSISAGTFLENHIAEIAPFLDDNKIQNIFDNTLKNGVYLLSKKSLKRYLTPYLNLASAIEPDFLIVDANKKECLVLELKDGDNFDTKKVKAKFKILKIIKMR